MKKVSLSLALCAALSVAAVAPTFAQSKKSSKPAQVTVNAPAPTTAVGYFQSCASANTQFWGQIPIIGLIAAPVSAVGCGAVWSVPILIQAFWPKA